MLESSISMQKLRPQTCWHHNLPAPLRKSPSPDLARDTIKITIHVGDTSRPREPAPGQAEGSGRAKPGSLSSIAALIAALLARRRSYALRPHSVVAGIDYLNLVPGCLGECLRCRPRRSSRPAASSRAGSHGDAQSEIVGLGQNRHIPTPDGEFQINAVPLGDYSVTVASPGFAQTALDVTVISGTVPAVHFQLQVATANEKVTVSATAPRSLPPTSATPITLVDQPRYSTALPAPTAPTASP